MKIDFNDNERHPYAMIYDVFSEEDFNDILKHAYTLNNGETIPDETDPYWDKYQDKAAEIYDSVFDTLFKLTRNPINKYINDKNRKSKFRIQFTVLQPGFIRNRIHRDADWKQLAIVVYFSDVGIGTMLYKENDPDTHYHTVPLVSNTAFCHIPSETSWHDFEHPDCYKEKRITLMFLLVDEEDYVR